MKSPNSSKVPSVQWNWDHVRTFEAVARLGGLSAAARSLGVSAATAGRHIAALEAEFGQVLFERRPDGYEMTAAGIELLPLAAEMSTAAARLERKRSLFRAAEGGTVRIAAGNWLSWFLLSKLNELRTAMPEVEFEIINSYGFANLAWHDADIALRNRRPEKGRVTVRRMPALPTAVYGSAEYVANHPESKTFARYAACKWVGYDESLAALPSARWLAGRRSKPPEVRCTQATNIVDGVRGGLGLALIPCCIAATARGLERVSETFELEETEVWMLIHEDLRQLPAVRRTADWIVDRYSREAVMGS